jgi:TolB-like protein
MSDVFISYKAEDRRRIRPLVQCLQSEGYSVWWDERIGAGDAWRETIERELDSAACVIVVWSKRSIGPEGGFVREEASRAQRRGVYVPVLIDAVDPPLGFGEKQATSLRGWTGDCADARYGAVHAAVARLAGNGSTQGTAPAAPVSRRAALIGGGVAVVAVAGIGGWELLNRTSVSTAKSIAVLPFANLSGDPRQAYFSDGVAEEIRSALTRLGGLTVIGSSSSEAVRNDDAKTAATKLGVANILTGSVRETPSTIRITAELIDGRTGADRWSQDYDRSPGDAIKIQTDIAANVATALKGALGLAARAAISVGGTQNPEAQRLLLQTVHIDAFSKQALNSALALINRAITLDPNYADAYARKAGLLNFYAVRFPSGTADVAALLEQAEQSANRAIELAPRLPAAHLAVAHIYVARLQLAAAKNQFQYALILDPNDPKALDEYAGFLAQIGKQEEALRYVEKLSLLEPLTPRSHAIRAFIFYLMHRFADSLAEQQLIVRRWPSSVIPLLFAETLMQLNRNDEAKQWLARTESENPIRLAIDGIMDARAGDRAGATASKARIRQLYGGAEEFNVAMIDAQLGDADQAFADLNRAWEAKDGGLVFLPSNPWLDPIRSDPRYAALVRKMNFPT